MKQTKMIVGISVTVSLTILILLGGYAFLSGVFKVPEPKRKPIVMPAGEPIVNTETSFWTAIAISAEDGALERLYLQYTDCIRDTVIFTEIPTDTKAELSLGALEVLRVYRPEMPKLFHVSELMTLSKEPVFCLALQEVVAELTGTRPRGCILIDKDTWEKRLGSVDTPFEAMGTPAEIIEDILKKSTAKDLVWEEELVYSESFADVRTVFYRTLPGTYEGGEYLPNAALFREFAQQYTVGNFTPTAAKP